MFDVSEKDQRKNKIWKLIPERAWCDSKILDCASGDGRKGIQYYMRQGVDPKNVVTIDVEDDNLKKLRDVGVETHCLDLEESDIRKTLKDQKFDIILCAETLEHLTGQAEKKLLKSFLGLLNKNGYLIVTFPMKVAIEKSVEKYGHIRQPQRRNIRNALKHNFRKCEIIKFKRKNKKGTTIILYFQKKVVG